MEGARGAPDGVQGRSAQRWEKEASGSQAGSVRQPSGRRDARSGAAARPLIGPCIPWRVPRPGPAPASAPAALTRAAADAGGGAAAPAPARLLAGLAGRRQVVLLLAAQRLGRAHEAAQLVPAADAGPEAAPFASGAAGEALAGWQGVRRAAEPGWRFRAPLGGSARTA